jgi:hypothetical protein
MPPGDLLQPRSVRNARSTTMRTSRFTEMLPAAFRGQESMELAFSARGHARGETPTHLAWLPKVTPRK